MIVEVEITPNPETLKFLPGKKVSEIGPIEFLKGEEKIGIPLAKKILSLKGINMIFFGADFITVKKEKNHIWEDLKYGIIAEINDFYSNGKEVIIDKNFKKSSSEDALKSSDLIVDKINDVLNTKIRPAVARDGGDIKFKDFKDGVVTVELRGSCSGCPSSVITLKNGVQNLLCHYIPEVKRVDAL